MLAALALLRRPDQRRAGRQRRLHAVARLRPGPPADRGPELRLGLDRVRRPGHHDAGRAPARARFGGARHGPHARGADRDARSRPRRSAPPGRLARRPARAARRVRRHGPVHGRLPRPGSGRATASTSSRPTAARTGRSRCTAAAAPTGIRDWLPTWGGPADKATWELVATVPGAVHRRLQRAARERPAGAGGHAHGPRGARRSRPRPISSRSSSRRSRSSPTAGATSRWITTSILRTARSRRPLFGVTPDMIGDLQPAHRRAVSVEQVRPGHGRRLHRRDGERERHDAGGLAPRPPRVPATGPGTVESLDSPRAGAPVVRRPGHRGELGQLLAQRGHGRVHAGAVLGR